MAGRIMTRMTTDIDALSQLLQNGLVNAVGEPRDLRRAWRRAARARRRRSALGAARRVDPPLVVGDVWFRRRRAAPYDRAARRDRRGQRRTCRRASRASRDRRRSCARTATEQASASRAAATATPACARSGSVASTSRSSSSSPTSAPCVVLGVGARARRARLAHGRRARSRSCSTSTSSSRRSSSSRRCSTRGSRPARRIAQDRRAAGHADVDAAAGRPRAIPAGCAARSRFDDVRFRYSARARRGACAASTCAIPPGETVALVGETGAGKSTVVKLVARFYDPTDGPRRSSTASTCATLDLGAFRRQLGFVPQEAFLFPGTIRDNIAYGRADATDAEVEAAARAVGAHDFIALAARRLPDHGDRAGPVAVVRPAPAHRPGPGASSSTPRSCCSTRPRRTSTSPARPQVQRAMTRWPRAARRSSSPTACRPPASPTASSCRRRADRRGRHPRRAARRTAGATPRCGTPSRASAPPAWPDRLLVGERRGAPWGVVRHSPFP